MRLRTGAALFGVWLAGPGMAALSGEEHSLMPDGVRLRGPVERAGNIGWKFEARRLANSSKALTGNSCRNFVLIRAAWFMRAPI